MKRPLHRRTPFRLAIAATAVVATATALAGCSSSSAEDETGDIRVWFMDGSVPDTAIDWLETEFAAEHPGSTLTVEVQGWEDIVAKLQTSLASETETPDIVEIGNTQSVTFTSVGAFADISDLYDDLGGDDLIQSFVEAGTTDGVLYTTPLYAGSRVIVYRTDLFEEAGLTVPTTLEELNEDAEALTEANPEGVDGFKAMYLAAVDWQSLNGWLFGAGGQWATDDSGTWEGSLSSDASQEGIMLAQDLLTNWALGGTDTSDAAYEPWNDFNAGRVGMMSIESWATSMIDTDLMDEGKVGAFVLPGLTADEPGTAFAGGSNVGISAKSSHKELAEDAMRLIYSQDFMGSFNDLGYVPGNTAFYEDAGIPFSDLYLQAATDSELTPAATNWAVVESENIPVNFWQAIAAGDDPVTTAADTDADITEILAQ